MKRITDEKTVRRRPPKPHKLEQVSELAALLDGSSAAILTDYRGLTVAEITDLRRRLQQAGAEYRVVKNTLFRIACTERAPALQEHLAGPIAVAFAREDPVAPAKTIYDFIRDKRKVEVRVGLVDGKVYQEGQLRQLSQLPSREALVGQVVGLLQAPVYELVGTLQNILSELVWTLQAIEEQKASAGA